MITDQSEHMLKVMEVANSADDEPPHQIHSYTLLFSLFLHFLYIVNPPLHTSTPT